MIRERNSVVQFSDGFVVVLRVRLQFKINTNANKYFIQR